MAMWSGRRRALDQRGKVRGQMRATERRGETLNRSVLSSWRNPVPAVSDQCDTGAGVGKETQLSAGQSITFCRMLAEDAFVILIFEPCTRSAIARRVKKSDMGVVWILLAELV